MNATFDDVKAVRLVINDPVGIVNVLQIADETHFPLSPVAQTAYQSIATGKFYITDKSSPAIKDWVQPKLYLADITIASIWDNYGHDDTVYRCLRLILAKLGQEMRLSSISSGTESATYTSLRDLYDFYKNLITMFKEQEDENSNNTTGQYGTIKRPRIAGGNL
jgi:hypothetical protein